MADLANITRRLFLSRAPLAAAAGALAVTPSIAAAEADEEFVAIPRASYDAIKEWQRAHRASVAAANAYSDYLRPIGIRRRNEGGELSPVEKAECDRLFAEHDAAVVAVRPSREKMIFALWRI